jgi:hypothetical protein
MLIDLQPITLIDFVHEVAEGYATLNSYFPEPKPNQRLDIDIGVCIRADSNAVTVGHCRL